METNGLCGKKYTAVQLRHWLQKLELPSTGTKSALLIRLNEVPVELRGECPMEEGEFSNTTIVDDENDYIEATKKCEENSSNSLRKDGGQTNDSVLQRIDGSIVQENECEETVKDAAKKMIGCDFENELLKKQLELVKKEKELLYRENELLKMMFEYENRNKVVDRPIVIEEKEMADISNEGELASNTNNFNVPFNILKEIIPEYDGGLFPEIWITKFKNITKTYNLDETTVKTLLMCKLKGKTQTWLHLKTNFISESSEIILKELKETFGGNENKLVMRRNFEARKWKYSESFTDYYNEKIMLSSKIGIDEEELIEHIIEGIPDIHLRIQANIQCFMTKTQLLQAFSKIQLKQPRQFRHTFDQINKEEANKFRCFNCNSSGHFASECQKPKRQVGACYGCGSVDHRVASCPERKLNIQVVTKDEYNA